MLPSVKEETSKTAVWKNITLTQSQKKEFKKALKRGIYQELYKRKMISKVQLNNLLDSNS